MLLKVFFLEAHEVFFFFFLKHFNFFFNVPIISITFLLKV